MGQSISQFVGQFTESGREEVYDSELGEEEEEEEGERPSKRRRLEEALSVEEVYREEGSIEREKEKEKEREGRERQREIIRQKIRLMMMDQPKGPGEVRGIREDTSQVPQAVEDRLAALRTAALASRRQDPSYSHTITPRTQGRLPSERVPVATSQNLPRPDSRTPFQLEDHPQQQHPKRDTREVKGFQRHEQREEDVVEDHLPSEEGEIPDPPSSSSSSHPSLPHPPSHPPSDPHRPSDPDRSFSFLPLIGKGLMGIAGEAIQAIYGFIGAGYPDQLIPFDQPLVRSCRAYMNAIFVPPPLGPILPPPTTPIYPLPPPPITQHTTVGSTPIIPSIPVPLDPVQLSVSEGPTSAVNPSQANTTSALESIEVESPPKLSKKARKRARVAARAAEAVKTHLSLAHSQADLDPDFDWIKAYEGSGQSSQTPAQDNELLPSNLEVLVSLPAVHEGASPYVNNVQEQVPDSVDDFLAAVLEPPLSPEVPTLKPPHLVPSAPGSVVSSATPSPSVAFSTIVKRPSALELSEAPASHVYQAKAWFTARRQPSKQLIIDLSDSDEEEEDVTHPAQTAIVDLPAQRALSTSQAELNARLKEIESLKRLIAARENSKTQTSLQAVTSALGEPATLDPNASKRSDASG